MPDAVILEFDGVTREQYESVNAALGLDPVGGGGDWPDGMHTHMAGTTPAGGLVVSEIWDSPEKQAAFMEERLGAALAEVAVPPPVRVTWISLLAHHEVSG